MLHLQHAAAHLCYLQQPPIANAIEYLASKCILCCFFLLHLHLVFVFGPSLAGTSYRQAAFPINKNSIALFATLSTYCTHAGITPPTHEFHQGPIVIIVAYFAPAAMFEQLLSWSL